MKAESGKPKKQRQQIGAKARTACGTLSYLAECRGTQQKAGPFKGASPPESLNWTVRRYPAVQ